MNKSFTRMMATLMGLKSVSPKKLYQEIQNDSLHIFDLNSIQSYNQGHVPGAVHLNHETFNGSELPSDKSASLVFYCSNPMCRKAPIAARLAKSKGYVNVRVLSAGISGWMNKNLPIENA